MAIFNQAYAAIDKHLRHEDWYLWATMTKGYVTMAVFQSLEAYWPGVLTLVGMLAILGHISISCSYVKIKYAFFMLGFFCISSL